MGEAVFSVLILLSFCGYLRPGEPFKLQVQDFVPPIGHGGFCLILHPYENLVSSKTHEFDETVPLDLEFYRFIAEASFRILRIQSRAKTEKLFTTTASAFSKFLQQTSQDLQLTALGPLHPYRFRHGGASADFLCKRRSLEDLTRIGRWRSFKSVRRYEKGARATQLLSLLPDGVRVAALSAENELRQRLSQVL